jgi:hypothetical protein
MFKVFMYDGSIKKLEDVKIDDVVMGDDATPRQVINVTQGHGHMYKITPSKGDSFIISENHILSMRGTKCDTVTWDKNRNKHVVRCLIKNSLGYPELYHKRVDSDDISDAEAHLDAIPNKIWGDEILDIPLKVFQGFGKHLQANIKLFRTGLEFPAVSVTMDPYLIGYWLGDGTSAAPQITTADPEIVAYFTENLKQYNCHLHQVGTREYTYNITSNSVSKTTGCNKFRNALVDYNLLNNKHIPTDYLYNTRDIRLKVLAGLIDSDGHYKSHNYDFTMSEKYEKLIDNLIFLARSLGFACYKEFKMAVCTNGANGPVECPSYSFHMSGFGIEDIPCILPRKKATPRETKKRSLVTAINNIEVLPKQSYTMIELDGNGRHVMDDLTVIQSEQA